MRKVNFILCFIGLVWNASCQSKPNILWLTYEDTSPHFIGSYGNSEAKTPVMDKLAEKGVRFTSAFSNGAVCSPSRFTLITGCRTTKYGTGHHRSSYPLPENIEAFPKYLREAGYYTSNNVKTDYNTNKAKHFIKTGWNESSSKAGWWKRESGQPFFSVFNMMSSHQSRTMTFSWSQYKNAVLDKLGTEAVIGDNDFDVPPIFNDTPEMRKQLSRIYNSIQYTDIQFGKILERLEKDGLADDTIIFCFADHGEGMPWGKTYARGMGYRVPFIIYFPEKYKHLSPWGTNVVTDDIIDFSDLPATILSIAGIKVPDYIDGRPLIGQQAEKTKKYTIGSVDRTGESTTLSRSISDGEVIYTRRFMPFEPEKRWQKYFDIADISGIMLKDYKAGELNKTQEAIYKLAGSELLFNLKEDPWETNNLTESPEYLKKIKKLKTVLKKDLIESKDAHFIPEYTLILEQKNAFDLCQSDGFYPVKEVIETAFLCGEEEVLDKQLSLLNHKNDIVRYWASVGIYSHLVLFGTKQKELILTGDSYPPADIFIQASKAHFQNDKNAEGKLLSYLSGSNEQLGILTAQLLSRPENIDKALLNGILDICKKSEIGYVKRWGEMFELKYLDVPLKMSGF